MFDGGDAGVEYEWDEYFFVAFSDYGKKSMAPFADGHYEYNAGDAADKINNAYAVDEVDSVIAYFDEQDVADDCD